MKSKNLDELIEKLDSRGWTFSDEREFTENLFTGRFNYFLLVFPLFITAGFANSFTTHRYLVFYFGALILFCCWIPLIRAYKKLDIILDTMFTHIKDHPASIMQQILKKRGFKRTFTITNWMGVYIPALCVILLLFVGILVNIGCIK